MATPVFSKLTQTVSDDIKGEVQSLVDRTQLLAHLNTNPFQNTTTLNSYNNTNLSVGDKTTIIGDGVYQLASKGPNVWNKISDDAVSLTTTAVTQSQTNAAFAEEFSGPVYTTPVAGAAAVTTGKFFRVSKGTTPETYDRYERTGTAPFYKLAAGLATTVDLASTASGNGVDLIARVPYPVTNRTALKALSTNQYQAAILQESGREGVFRWDGGDHSSDVIADPFEAIFVPSNASPSGSGGAWVRYYNGLVHLEWGGFSETETAANNALIIRAMLDNWACTCGTGTFPLATFQVKSNARFWGSGKDTIFDFATGKLVKFGCLAGDSVTRWDADVAPYVAINNVTNQDTIFTTSTPADASDFEAGETAAIWSSVGYVDGYGEFKPALQQIVGVVNADPATGVVQLDGPILGSMPSNASFVGNISGTTLTWESGTVPFPGHVLSGSGVTAGTYIVKELTSTTFQVSVSQTVATGTSLTGTTVMFASPGQTMTGREQGTDVGIGQNINFGNLTVRSQPGESWTRFGGVYKSTIGPIYVDGSNGFVVMNGLCKSKVIIGAGSVTRNRLVDMGLFGADSTIIIEDGWSDFPGITATDNLIGFGEGVRDITVNVNSGSNKSSSARNSFVTATNGARRCVVNVSGRVFVSNATYAFAGNRAANSPMSFNGNELTGSGYLELGTCVSLLNASADTAGESNPFTVSIARIRAGDVTEASGNAIVCKASGLTVRSTLIDMPAGKFISVNAASLNNDVSTAQFVNLPGFSISAGGQITLPRAVKANKNIDYLAANYGTGTAIQSTTVTTFYSRTVAANSFQRSDSVRFDIFGTTTGTVGAKYVDCVVAGTTVTLTIPSTFAGNFRVEGTITVLTTSAIRVYMSATLNGATSVVQRGNLTYDTSTNSTAISIGARVVNTADGITPESVEVRPLRDVTRWQ